MITKANMAAELRKRADEFESGALRWVKGAPHNPGEACLRYINSGRQGQTTLSFNAQTIQKLFQFVQKLWPPARGLTDWNDDKVRTREDVIRLLRSLADELDPQKG
jgi:hypothetical protein